MDFSNMNDVKIPAMEKPETASPLDKLNQPENFGKNTNEKSDGLEKLNKAEDWGSKTDILENPPPNSKIDLPDGGYIITDEQGRVIEKVFKPVLTEDKRTAIDNARTTAVGKEGREGDHGGHIQAHRLGGGSERTNLFPQDGNFNTGAYKRFENYIAKSLEQGQDVSQVSVKLKYDDPSNQKRPTTVEVSVTVDGKPINIIFKNENGGGLNDTRTANS